MRRKESAMTISEKLSSICEGNGRAHHVVPFENFEKAVVVGNMSWQPYIDDHLLAELPHGGRLEHAAIVSHSGDVWAQSDNFPELSSQEAEAIVNGFDDQATLAQNGLFVGGNKYIVVAGEEGAVIRGKQGQSGVTIKKTNTALVVGIYNQTVPAGDANVVVENMGDYLIEQGM